MKRKSHDEVKFIILKRVIRYEEREDFDKFRRLRLLEEVERCKSLKKCRQTLVQHSQLMTAVRPKH